MGSCLDRVGRLEWEIRLSSCLVHRMTLHYWRRRPRHNSRHRGRTQPRETGNALDPLCPIARQMDQHSGTWWRVRRAYLHGCNFIFHHDFLCETVEVLNLCLQSLKSGLTHKSAPIVALYWLLNLLLTYWFIRDVFPTLESSNMTLCQP